MNDLIALADCAVDTPYLGAIDAPSGARKQLDEDVVCRRPTLQSRERFFDSPQTGDRGKANARVALCLDPCSHSPGDWIEGAFVSLLRNEMIVGAGLQLSGADIPLFKPLDQFFKCKRYIDQILALVRFAFLGNTGSNEDNSDILTVSTPQHLGMGQQRRQ